MAKTEKSEQTDKKISKMEAVRRILAEYGQDTKPLDIQSHVKSKFGLNMDTTVISSYKSSLKAAKKPAANGNKPTKATSHKTEGGIRVDDIRAIKEVADRIGADKVKELVEVLGK